MFYTLLKVQHFFESLYQSLVSILRVIFRLRFSSGLKHLNPDGSEIFVLANGPSLRDDLDNYGNQLASKTCLGVNMFALSGDFEKIRPEYYVMLDIGFFIENTIPRVKEARDKVLASLGEKLSWEMTLLVPAEGKNSYFHKQLLSKNLSLNFVFFNRTVVTGFRGLRHFMYSKGLGMPPPQNVLIGSLVLALNAGFSSIYVLGADHSWHRDLLIGDDGGIEISDKHFYDKKSARLKVIHPETLEQSKIHDFFANLARTFKSYHLIEQYAKSRGVKILNASSISYIDAFDKVKLEDILGNQPFDK